MLARVDLSQNNLLRFTQLENASFCDDTKGLFSTQKPVYHETISNSSEELLKAIQNEVSGVKYNSERDELILFSAKLSRSRIFYTFSNKACWLSDDLRKLLPYTSKKLNLKCAFAILKFGELPESETIIQDIYSIPCGEFIKLDSASFNKYLTNGGFTKASFSRYFFVRYSYSGGRIDDTERVLIKTLEDISPLNPSLFISGGIDSTLLNFLYSQVKQQPYQAFFLDFENAPTELAYVKRSVVGTNAELVPIRMEPKDILSDFCKSINHLIYPVYDNGSALVGYQLRKYLDVNNALYDHTFIDGTLADSCYGVRDYNNQLVQGRVQPVWLSTFKEWTYMNMLQRGWYNTATKPRDAYLDDEFLQDLLWNGGPYINFWFKNAKHYSNELKQAYHQYYKVLESGNQEEYWPKYTVLKMMLYAAKQTTVKTYDMLLPAQVYFPFMFKDVLQDQGKYTWQQKSEGNVIKAPLKKLLEKFIDSEFIYRKKMGLQSQTRSWLLESSIKPFITDLISKKDGVAATLMGSNRERLIKGFSKESPERSLISLVMALSVIQLWCDINLVTIDQ